MSSPEVVWAGPDALRPFLVSIADLEAFPNNPRRGDVPAIAASFRRWGQLKPIVTDGPRIVAGHHMVLAAGELGWTHIAAVANDFADEDEQRAFLLADNRTAELGTVDLYDLTGQLQQLAELDLLAGTGYTGDDVDGFLADLALLQDAATDPSVEQVSFTARPRPPGDEREVVLHYSPTQHGQVETWLTIIAKEAGTSGVSETMYEALRIAALQLNQK